LKLTLTEQEVPPVEHGLPVIVGAGALPAVAVNVIESVAKEVGPPHPFSALAVTVALAGAPFFTVTLATFDVTATQGTVHAVGEQAESSNVPSCTVSGSGLVLPENIDTHIFGWTLEPLQPT
jgi:hypothetical protein